LKTRLFFTALSIILIFFASQLVAQTAGDPLIEGFRLVEVASVADAIEQLYGIQSYLPGDVRPLFTTKFVGPAVTVEMKKAENKEPNPLAKMIETIDTIKPGAVFVLAAEGDIKYGVLGGLMGTTLKYRGAAGAVTDAAIRDAPQLKRIQLPVYSRGVAPGTTVGHFRVTGVNVPVVMAGVKINPGDIIAADEDGVVIIPRERAAEVLKKAQELDFAEHSQLPLIEQTKSLAEAIKRFGRL